MTRTLLALLLLLTLQASAAPPDAVRPILTRGARGDAVRILQHLLNEERRPRGEAELGIDGAFGPATERALQAFRQRAGLSSGANVDPQTWRALLAAAEPGPLGRIDPTAPTGSATYRLGNEGPSDVAIHRLPSQEVAPGQRAQPLLFSAKFAIDADGAGDAWRSDPWGQPETSLQWGGGRSLDPTQTPFYVLPIGFEQPYPGVRLGDVAAVIYRGRVAFAIFGDRGPRTKIGEGSILLARQLGIDPDPRTGGVGGGVLWIVFPGSGTGRPLDNAEIERRGRALLQAAGGRLPQ